MMRRSVGFNGLLTIALALVMVTAGIPQNSDLDEAPPGLVQGPDGEWGRWEDLGKAGQLWVPLDPPEGDSLLDVELGDYHNYDEMVEVLHDLSSERPEVFTVVPIGESVEGRVIWMIRVAGEGGPLLRPKVLLDGAHHANEIIGSEILIRFLLEVHESYDTDEQMRDVLSQVVLHIVPMVNVDRVMALTQCSSYADCRKNANGVDLNRNYPSNWGGQGSSSNPNHPTYHGPFPLSEPESRAVALLLETFPYSLHVTFHSGIELILWPYGYTTAPPADLEAYQQLGQELSQVTDAVRHGQTSHILYTASGTTMDYAYDGALGGAGLQPLSFTPEVYRGSGWDWFTVFNPPAMEHEIVPVVDKWLPFVWHMAEVAPDHAHDLLEPVAPLEVSLGGSGAQVQWVLD